MMWIRVYRTSSRTGERTTVKPLRTVKPAKEPDTTSTFPKCGCPLHRKDGGGRR